MALPLALFGLVVLSVLVTSALLTSSTELALSRAHQDGVRRLYAADAALERFVAERAALTADTDARFTTGTFVHALPSGAGYTIDVAELYRGPPLTRPGGTIERLERYSLVSVPTERWGRSVGALIEARRIATPVSFNIDSGLMLGASTTISGSATVSDGSSPGAACDSAAAPAAIHHASGTIVDRPGDEHDVFGDIVVDDMNSSELMSWVLDGRRAENLAVYAHIQFGPRFDRPAFAGTPVHTASDSTYRWGCPSDLVGVCNTDQKAYFPVVAIDADGATVDITGHHGQGVILVLNGNLHIGGGFSYAGMVVVEGVLRITGSPRIEGGVIAMGDEVVIEPGTENDISSGNSLIRFNRCQVVNAVESLTLQSLNSAPQTIDTPTYAWFEVIR